MYYFVWFISFYVYLCKGIPYGTVNLRKGVPPKETHIASTAGAGSLLVEFEVLSTITGDDRYGNVALRATVALFERRNRYFSFFHDVQ